LPAGLSGRQPLTVDEKSKALLEREAVSAGIVQRFLENAHSVFTIERRPQLRIA